VAKRHGNSLFVLIGLIEIYLIAISDMQRGEKREDSPAGGYPINAFLAHFPYSHHQRYKES
jgi:hypothetical protein